MGQRSVAGAVGAVLGLVTVCSIHCGVAESVPSVPSSGPPPWGGDAAASADVGADVLRPAGPSDGVCTPGAMGTGILDPDCAYGLGTLRPGISSYDALGHPSNPHDLIGGFGQLVSPPVVRPDGRIAFVSYDGAMAGIYLWSKTPLIGGPIDLQLLPHERLSFPRCRTPHKLWVYPDDGKTLVYCVEPGGGYFVEGATTPTDFGAAVVAAGARRSVLGSSGALGLVIVRDGIVTPLKPTDFQYIVATRARKTGGFLMAVARPPNQELITVDESGDWTVSGAYDLGAFPIGPECALEGSGALVCITGLGRAPAHRGMVRYTLDAPPTVQYDEADGPWKFHIPSVVTGP